MNREGRVLGEHAGLIRYTIGQRKGIGVAAREPLYVLGKDAFANQLIVGFKDELLSSGVVACDVNLISGGVLEGPREVQVKTHYRQRPRASGRRADRPRRADRHLRRAPARRRPRPGRRPL